MKDFEHEYDFLTVKIKFIKNTQNDRPITRAMRIKGHNISR
jgi:hypothetical protein